MKLQDIDYYRSLITSEHRDKPNFMAVVAAICQPWVDLSAALISLIDVFDLDQAVGVQLDAVGEWVGLSRYLPEPLTGIYFTWDDTATTGWDSGIWRGEFDPITGLTRLPDPDYRTLLRAKIAANSWDGTMESAYDIWALVFAGSGQRVILQDRQDMSMIVGFAGAVPSAIQQQLLVGGYFPLKPIGVRIAYYAIPVNNGPLFAWDTQSEVLQGWDAGSWPREI